MTDDEVDDTGISGWRERFAQRFAALGLTQEQLSEKLGVSPGTIGHWLSGRRTPANLKTYQRLAEAMGISTEWLLFGIAPEQVVGREAAELAAAWEQLPHYAKASLKLAVQLLLEHYLKEQQGNSSASGSR